MLLNKCRKLDNKIYIKSILKNSSLGKSVFELHACIYITASSINISTTSTYPIKSYNLSLHQNQYLCPKQHNT